MANERISKLAGESIPARESGRDSQLNEEFQEILNFYKGLYSNKQLGIFRTDLRGQRFIECNDCLARMYGYADRAALLGQQPIRQHYARLEDREALVDELNRAGELGSVELELVTLAGEPLWVLFSAWIYRERGYIEGIMEDITPLKRIQEALRVSEAKYSRLFNESPDMIILSDYQTGEILECNDSIQRLIGWTRLGAVGYTTLDLGIWPSRLERERMLSRVRHRDAPDSYETSIIARDGRVVPVLLSISIIEVGGRKCLITSARDLTEHRLLELESLRRDKLEAAITLAGGIAHDFNNLLGSILGNIEMLKYSWGQDSERSLRLIDNARQECERARQLTHKFLTISRGSAPARRAGALADLIRATAEEAMGDFLGECECRLSADLHLVHYDDEQIRHVIANLVLNAVQSMPGGGLIRLIAENATVAAGDDDRGMRPGDYVCIRVVDEGCGIEAEHLPRIFDPYFSTKPLGRQKGLGLGLTIVHSVIKKHDGYIFVESRPHLGTSVTVYLPAAGEAELCDAI
ncbi:MAG: Sensor protein FixL [Deltaproteobacteria bacterium ADurb.Bin510]|nr:MAG: Sensor protein FixL [Deltaproteobacteria bacterium ADurb.Bin510]